MRKMTSTFISNERIEAKTSVNKQAALAACNAEIKGWKTWTLLNQSDVLDMATVVSQKPGTSWYFVLRFTEDQKQLWKVQATDHRQVLNEYLQYSFALEPSEEIGY